MRLYIVPKAELSEEQARYLNERLSAPEHKDDSGPCRVWNTYQFALYGFIDKETNLPIAIAEASGRPIATPGWWIDSKFRSLGFGNDLVDLLAVQLKSEGVTGLGRCTAETNRPNRSGVAPRLECVYRRVISASPSATSTMPPSRPAESVSPRIATPSSTPATGETKLKLIITLGV